MGEYNQPVLTDEDSAWAIGIALAYCKRQGVVSTADIDDATGVAALTMLECRPDHNARLSDFRTFAKRRIWWRLTDHFRKQARTHLHERPLVMCGMV
jgi:hypothetical protein